MWKVCRANDDGALHVVPLVDLRDHLLSMQCFCLPQIDDGVVVHNSMDRREEFERGKKQSR